MNRNVIFKSMKDDLDIRTKHGGVTIVHRSPGSMGKAKDQEGAFAELIRTTDFEEWHAGRIMQFTNQQHPATKKCTVRLTRSKSSPYKFDTSLRIVTVQNSGSHS